MKKNNYLSIDLDNLINHINITMTEINGHTDDIYESMTDHDCEQLVKSTDDLISLLKDLKTSYLSDEVDSLRL